MNGRKSNAFSLAKLMRAIGIIPSPTARAALRSPLLIGVLVTLTLRAPGLLGADAARIDLRQWQVMCWEDQRWNLHPPTKMSLAQKADAIHVEYTTGDNWLATFVHTGQKLEADFDAAVEVRGGRFITFIADDGADRTVYCDCPRDSQWHVVSIQRRGKQMSFNIDDVAARAHLNNTPDGAYAGFLSVQIEKGKAADLRRFAARVVAAEKGAPLAASPATRPSVKDGGADIHAAALAGDLERVRRLIQEKPSLVNAKDRGGQTALCWAVYRGHKDVAALLINKGADVNAPGHFGMTPLHQAALQDQNDCAELLLSNGAAVDARDQRGRTPLHVAALARCQDVAELLLNGGADVDARQGDGSTPLHVLLAPSETDVPKVLKRRDAMVKLLLSKGADANLKDKKGNTPQQAAAAARRDRDEQIWRKRFGNDPNGTDQNGMTPLESAAAANDTSLAELALAKGADPNLRGPGGYTPLHVAVERTYADVAAVLVAHGADVNAKDNTGHTPLDLAPNHGDAAMQELLRKSGGTKPTTTAPGAPLIANPALVATLVGSPSPAICLAISPDGRFIAAGSSASSESGRDHDGAVDLWEIASGKHIARFVQSGRTSYGGVFNIVRSVAIAPDSVKLATGDQVGVTPWDVRDRQKKWTIKMDTSWSMTSSLAFSPDGKMLAAQLKLLDAQSGRELTTLGTGPNMGGGVAFSPDGRWLAEGGYDNRVRIWDVPKRTRVIEEHAQMGILRAAAFSPDGTRLAVAGEGPMKIWPVSVQGTRITLGRPAMAPVGGGIPFTVGGAFAFSPDGSLLALAGQSVQLLSTTTLKPVATLPMGGIPAFSPDGKLLATTVARADAARASVMLWDLAKLLDPVAQAAQSRTAATVMVQMLRTGGDPDRIGPFISQLGPQSWAGVPILLQALKDPRVQTRFRITVALRQIGPAAQSAVGPLTEALNDDAPEVRMGAAQALQQIDPGALQHALASAKPPHQPTWHKGPQGWIYEGRTLTEWIELLGKHYVPNEIFGRSDDRRSREAIRQFGPKAVPELLKALAEKDWAVRAGAADALGLFDSEAQTSIPALTSALDDDVSTVRDCAAASLVKLGQSPEKLREAARANKAGRNVREGPIGGGGGSAFEDLTESSGLLKGVVITTADIGRGNIVITSIRPVFLTAGARAVGTTHGSERGGASTIMAKDGYAVGGLTLKAGESVEGLQITFMRVKPSGESLNPYDSYQSAWFGGTGGAGKRTLGGNGRRIVGLFGRSDNVVDAVGIVSAE